MIKSRLDPLGNVVLLYTCKKCLAASLYSFRKYTCNMPDAMVQLVWLGEAGEGLRPEDHSAVSYMGQDGPPEGTVHG